MGKGTFALGSKVLMADGTEKSIEEVVVGDAVASYDISTNQMTSSIVKKIDNYIHGNLINYVLNNGKTLSCSFAQPVYTLDFVLKSWDNEQTALNYENPPVCEQMLCFSLLFDADAKLFDVEVAAIDVDWSKTDKESLKLELDSNHNYFVEKILVHE